MQNYAVKKTFVPDDKLEMQYVVDKEEEVMVNLKSLILNIALFF
jgi:hypothetical protein